MTPHDKDRKKKKTLLGSRTNQRVVYIDLILTVGDDADALVGSRIASSASFCHGTGRHYSPLLKIKISELAY
jgi:hypothetical protein